ncbi:MAG TPA: leucine-rich repeat domain-containing protein [Verrucomicrobiae bacterium]|nr:leucine-rich repeat domain-containing protein [Verrucomicrobiae bacterium]
MGDFARKLTTSIGGEAFSYCTNLTDITIPDSVTNIGSQAFYYCGSLTNITIGTNVMSIGDYAFDFCSGLTSITIPNSVANIGSEAFYYCGSLTNIATGTNVTSIGDYAFASCSGLTSITIPDSVANIGNEAFYYCGGLTNVSIGTGVTTIGRDAFAFCSSLTGITIPSRVTNIVANSSGIVRIGIGAPLSNGPIEMVANCGRLNAITVDEQNLFYSSTNGILFDKPQTTLLEAPGGFVGSYAVPDRVSSIGAEAFQNCASLTSVAIPNSVTNIGTAAFADCGSLTAMAVDGQNMIYSSINGILFDKPQTTLIQFPGGIGGNYTVSNGITSIGSTGFSGCSNLTSITIPNSVTNVGNSTFVGCLNAGIFFAGNAPGITSSATSPGFVVIRVFPIFGNNFYNPNAEAVYYLPGTTGWGATFDGLPAYLWVPPYVCTPTSNSITINGYNGFDGSITIPDVINGLPVTTIASGAFDNPGGLGLTNIIMGANVTTIGNYAFASCYSLTSLTIPNSVTSIGSGAFAFCDKLKSVYFQGNAPNADSSVFFHWSIFPPIYEPPPPTTVYYLPGTTGWGTTFGGCPTVLWNPQAQTSDGSFGVRTNRFGFNITGTSNLVIVVEACTNISDPAWTPISTNTLNTFIGTNGTSYFSDPLWTNYPSRFYHLRSP